MIGIAAMAPRKPQMIMKSIVRSHFPYLTPDPYNPSDLQVPAVMAGVLAIYGLVVGVIITQRMGKPGQYTLYRSV